MVTRTLAIPRPSAVKARPLTETGAVVEFHNEEIERLQKEVAEAHGFELVGHSLVLYVRPKV